MLRQYRIDKVIGQGGFGITYLAFDTDLQRQVAIKECYPRDFVAREGTTVVATTSENSNNFDWALGKFVDEATTLARFKHGGIVQVLQILKEENNSAYMVLEFVEGQSFDQWLKSKPEAPSEDELRKVIAPLVDALQVVHENGIAHRDVAPDNIYIRDNGEAVLLDFGTAKQTVSQQTRTMNLVVKDGYSAPEQYYAEGRQGPWTDIYAFAATLYRAIAGKRPADAMARQDALNNDEPDPLVHLSEIAPPKYSPDFLDAIMKGLTLQAKRRPQSLTEWRTLLLGKDKPVPVPAGSNDETHLVTPPSNSSSLNGTGGNGGPQQPSKQSQIGKVAAALVLLCLLAGGGYWFVLKQNQQHEATIPVQQDDKPKQPSTLVSEKKRQDDLARKLALKEEADWTSALTTDTLDGYRLFLRHYPNTRRIDNVEDAVKHLSAPWSKLMGGGAEEVATAVAAGFDSIAVAGSVKTMNAGRKGLIYLLSHGGKQRWRKVLDEQGEHEISDILLTDTGDVIVVGNHKASRSAQPQALAMRFDSHGRQLWKFILGDGGMSSLASVAQLPNGELVAVGMIDGVSGSDSDGWMVRLAPDGTMLSQHSYGEGGDDALNAVEALPTGEIAVVGRMQRQANGDNQFWLMKISTQGKKLWERFPGGRQSDEYRAVAVRPDGRFYAVGETQSLGTGSIDGMITFVAGENKLFPKPVMEKRDDVLTAAAVTRDGGFLAGGYTTSKGAGQTDGWVTKYDGNLKTVIWQRVIGTTGKDQISAIDVLPDGSIVAAGSRLSNSKSSGFWVVKIGPDGEYDARERG